MVMITKIFIIHGQSKRTLGKLYLRKCQIKEKERIRIEGKRRITKKILAIIKTKAFRKDKKIIRRKKSLRGIKNAIAIINDVEIIFIRCRWEFNK